MQTARPSGIHAHGRSSLVGSCACVTVHHGAGEKIVVLNAEHRGGELVIDERVQVRARRQRAGLRPASAPLAAAPQAVAKTAAKSSPAVRMQLHAAQAHALCCAGACAARRPPGPPIHPADTVIRSCTTAAWRGSLGLAVATSAVTHALVVPHTHRQR